MSSFYFRRNDETVGPVSGVILREAALAGEVTTETLVATDPEGKWVPASPLSLARNRIVPTGDG